MRRRSTQTFTAATGALVGAVVLAGCGSQPADEVAMSPVAAVKAASTATAAAETARLHLELRLTRSGDTSSVTVDGPVALDGSRADLTASLPGSALGAAGTITAQERVVDGSAYVKVAGVPLLPGTWIRLGSDTSTGSGSDGLGGALSGITGTGARDLVSALEQVGEVTTVGIERVGGTSATHYRATVDPAKLAGSLAALPGMGSAGAALGSTPIPVDLWVDAQGHLVKVTQTLTRPGSTDTVAWELELTDLGAPVTVTAPEGAVDLGSLLGGLDLGSLLDGLGGLGGLGGGTTSGGGRTA